MTSYRYIRYKVISLESDILFRVNNTRKVEAICHKLADANKMKTKEKNRCRLKLIITTFSIDRVILIIIVLQNRVIRQI